LYKLNIKKGDVILRGKFRNKKVVVKTFGYDDNGQPTINGKPMLNFRIEKLMPKKEKQPEAVQAWKDSKKS
jgi:hypothetical protein